MAQNPRRQAQHDHTAARSRRSPPRSARKAQRAGSRSRRGAGPLIWSALAMDAVEKAKSGHPGTPMALAPVAYTLWQEFLRFDCEDPNWLNRDRFVLSNGHASMLLYGLLHLAQVKDASGKPAVTLDDIEA